MRTLPSVPLTPLRRDATDPRSTSAPSPAHAPGKTLLNDRRSTR